MEFKNFTPFAGIAWENVNADNLWSVTSLVRGRFKLIKSESSSKNNSAAYFWQPHPEQGDLFDEDVFYPTDTSGNNIDSDTDSAVRYESDYIIFKPYSDIIVNANTYPPDAEKSTGWQCGIRLLAPGTEKILNQLELAVKGPMGARDLLFRQATDKVAVRYEHCRGGIQKIKNKGKEDEAITVDRYNPIGCGRYDLANHTEDLSSPQIYYLDGHKTVPMKNVPPGFGFIHRSWQNRLDYAGTYDQDWLDKQWPLPPHDFNAFHNQAAHPALITKSYLQPGSKIVLTNLIKGEPESWFTIPDYQFLARISTNLEKTLVTMHLDTLIIDINAEDQRDFSVYASWRAYNRVFDEAVSAEVMLIPPDPGTARGDNHDQ